jgi:hypothetical protein
MRIVTSLAAGLALASTATAHHGFGTFDLRSDIELTGTLQGLDFVNPHSWLYVDVTREDGTVAAYRCEMRAATVLRRSGWTPEMFVAGQTITVTGSPDRNDPNSCYVGTVIFADGSSIDRYGQRTAATRAVPAVPAERALRRPNGDPNIAGDWAPEQFVMTDPRGQSGTLVPLSTARTLAPGDVPEGQQAMRGTRGNDETPGQAEGADTSRGPWSTAPVEFTALGRQAADEFEMYTTDNPRMRCETTSIIFDWTFDGPVNRIIQNDDPITLRYGQLGFTRTIHMNLDTHPANIEPSRGGHSIGRWENDVLIVDTVGFAPGVLSPPILNSDQLHVVERFSLDPERMMLTREYVAEDPAYFVGQYRGSDTIQVADLPYSPDPCNELTFVDFSAAGQQADAPAEEAAKPWWKFWD